MFIDIKEQVAVVQAYIAHLKNIEVDVNMAQFQDPINMVKLNSAYQIAVKWFQDNNGRIEHTR